MRPLLEYASQIWNLFLKYQIDLIESVQRSFTKRLPGFANLTYAERLLNLQLQSLQQRHLLFDIKMCYNIVYGVCYLRFSDFFTYLNNFSTRGHSLKLAILLCKHNTRKYFFAVRIVPVWNSHPEHIVSASNPAVFKKLISTHDFSLFLNFPCVSF